MFGDAPNLCKSSMLWWLVVQAMATDPCRVGFYMHLTCKKHNEKTFIKGEIYIRQFYPSPHSTCSSSKQSQKLSTAWMEAAPKPAKKRWHAGINAY